MHIKDYVDFKWSAEITLARKGDLNLGQFVLRWAATNSQKDIDKNAEIKGAVTLCIGWSRPNKGKTDRFDCISNLEERRQIVRKHFKKVFRDQLTKGVNKNEIEHGLLITKEQCKRIEGCMWVTSLSPSIEDNRRLKKLS